MEQSRSTCKLLWTGLSVVLVILLANPVNAAITPKGSYEAAALADPVPAVFAWNGSIGYYDNQLIYCGDDKMIYAYDLDTGASTLVSDTSGLGGAWGNVTGFLVSSNDYLYFHDNGDTTKIYRLLLTNAWPAAYESFDTGCSGSIYCFTQNPWTDFIWFASADFGAPSNMYLYEVNGTFTAATQRASFAQPNGGGSGPIIFKEEQTLLYGESVWGGDGYFHVVDTATGAVTRQDYILFDGGLAGACYGYGDYIYVTAGSGNTIYYIDGNTKTVVGAADEDAQGIAFGGGNLYVCEQKSSDWSGTISLHRLWSAIGAIITGDGSNNCFIGASGAGSAILERNVSYVILVSVFFLSIFSVVRFFRRKR
jgi:hypothetical protein